MPAPEAVGRVHANQARAVQVREPESVQFTHSAVSGTLNIYTDTRKETQAIIDAWDEIILAVDEKVTEVLARQDG